MSELTGVDRDATAKVPPCFEAGPASGPASEPESGPVHVAREEILLVRAAHGVGDEGLVARLAETGLPVSTAVPGEALLAALIEQPPALLVLDLEPFEPSLLAFARGVRASLSQLSPSILAVMRTDDETLLERTLAAGVEDVIEAPASAALLRVKVLKNAKRRAAVARSIGGYSIGRVLGRGGMGVVYEVTRDGERFALKVLETGPTADGEALVRFRREMEALRALQGPGIPRFYEAGRTADCFFYVMEYVEGRTLHSLAHGSRIAESALRRVACDVASALHAIHEAGFVHRDIKPGNIIVGPGGEATLIDYGLTKLVDDLTLTKSDEVFGTLIYIAPEVLRGSDASPASDAYALGMTLFHAALGESPLVGSARFIAHRIMVGEIPRPSERLPRLTPDLRAILDGLLARDPEDRLSVVEARRLLAPDEAGAPADDRALDLTLHFLSGARAGETLSFRSPCRIVVGRASDCEVTVLDADVSRRHCTIALQHDAAQVKDLGSANGTFVNGVRKGLAVLRDGDRIRLADTELRATILSATRTSRIRAVDVRDFVRRATSDDDALEVPGFDLIRPIGAGQSSVYEARSRISGQLVAIKVLRSRAELSAECRERFLREAQTACALVHPHVVRVLGRGEARGTLYLVMELIEGETLGALVARKGPLAVPLALRIVQQIASALELARTCGIVHRDVKPENILVQPDGLAKLSDFGLAKWPLTGGEAGLTQKGAVLGTVAYMAPEQLTAARTADHRADIYSLGATLHHALAGGPPFKGKTVVECYRKVLAEEPPSVVAVRPDVPPIVLALLARCLRKAAGERPQTAGELVRLLGTLLASAADRATVFDAVVSAAPADPPIDP